MKTHIRLFSPLMIESTEENLRDEYEKKLGRLPLWWWPCAVIAFGIPFMTLALIIFT
jgi:hypothetical protein